jgi:GAF domain-containing protein
MTVSHILSVDAARTPERRLVEVAREIERLLSIGDVHAALRQLNQRTRHRFTGVYRLEPPMLRSVALYDRENPELHVGGDMPLNETYCSITAETQAPVAIDDARRVEVLRDHPARDSVLSYCGVPLTSDDGSRWGTLCHFDLRPRIVPLNEIPLMQRVAPAMLRAVASLG